MELNTVKSYFGIADIVVFSLMLLMAALIGVFYAYKDRKKFVTNYYFGGKNMSPFPVGISTAVSFISAITVMTFPADVYNYGTVVLWYSFTTILPTITACLYFIPLYHRLQLVTIYELLEKRFSIGLRKLCSAVEIFNQIFYLGITIYLPALALNAVTPLKLNWSIALTGGICTFYTAIGGIKAVIWTDTLQASIMLLGVLAAFIKATIEVGGLGKAWESLERHDANNVWNFNPDPRIRTTFWTVIIGFSCSQSFLACTNQSVAQRYLSCKSIKDAQKSAVYTIIPKVSLSIFCILGGVAAFAYFEGCDPIKSKLLSKPEQIMPYLVLVLFRDIPGLAGFYVAAVYSATMSTVSSGMNALAAQLLQDFLLSFKKNMTMKEKMVFSKVAVFFLGLLITSIAFVASILTGSVLKMVLLFRGACGGPLFGIFCLAIFFPWTNIKGALLGQIIGTTFSMWIAVGKFVYGTDPEFLRKISKSADSCPVSDQFSNVTASTDFYSEAATSTGFSTETDAYYPPLYSLSMMHNSVVGFLTCIVVGLGASFITGASNPKNADPQYFVPFVDNRRFPKAIRTFFRFGVPLDDSNYKENVEQPMIKQQERRDDQTKRDGTMNFEKEDANFVSNKKIELKKQYTLQHK